MIASPYGIDARLLPREVAHVAAELARHHLVQVVEVGRDVDARASCRPASLPFGSMLTHVTEAGSTPLILASAGQRARCASPGGTPIRLPAKVLDAGDARALQPVHAERGIGVDVEDRGDVGALAECSSGPPPCRRARAARCRPTPAGSTPTEPLPPCRSRSIPAFSYQAHLLGVVERRVIAAGDPVEGDLELLGGARRRGDGQHGGAGEGESGEGGVRSMHGHGVSRAFQTGYNIEHFYGERSMLVEVRGKTLSVEVQGAGDPVVLLHGLGSTANVWEPQVRALADRFTLVRYDLEGMGRSPAAGPLSIESVGAGPEGDPRSPGHLARPLRRPFARHPHPAALRRRPPGAGREAGPHRRQPGAARGAPAGRSATASPRSAPKESTPIVETVVKGGVSPHTLETKPEVVAFVRELLTRQPAEGYARSCEAMAASVAADVGAIRAPVLLLAGRDDAVSPAGEQRTVVADLAERAPAGDRCLRPLAPDRAARSGQRGAARISLTRKEPACPPRSATSPSRSRTRRRPPGSTRKPSGSCASAPPNPCSPTACTCPTATSTSPC